MGSQADRVSKNLEIKLPRNSRRNHTLPIRYPHVTHTLRHAANAPTARQPLAGRAGNARRGERKVFEPPCTPVCPRGPGEEAEIVYNDDGVVFAGKDANGARDLVQDGKANQVKPNVRGDEECLPDDAVGCARSAAKRWRRALSPESRGSVVRSISPSLSSSSGSE